MRAALTIAGSDSGGGAGIQADLKTFEAHGVFGTSALTALTAQNTQGVSQVWPVPIDMVQAQLQAILSDFQIGAAKTGMLFDAAIIQTVAASLKEASFPLIVDPVMVSTSGHALLQPEAIAALKKFILPLATLVTPNIPEATLLVGHPIESREAMVKAASTLAAKYPTTGWLIKGFHLPPTAGSEEEISDLFFFEEQAHWLSLPRIDTPNTHGTGCTLSAAITAELARGTTLEEAVRLAKNFTHSAIQYSWANLGQGRGTLRHNFRTLQPHEA